MAEIEPSALDKLVDLYNQRIRKVGLDSVGGEIYDNFLALAKATKADLVALQDRIDDLEVNRKGGGGDGI